MLFILSYKRFLLLWMLLFINAGFLFAQPQHYEYNRYDSLRGYLNPARASYKVHFYDLQLKIEPDRQYISGSNNIYFTAEKEMDSMQVDLFSNMKVKDIVFRNMSIRYRRDSNHIFIYLPEKLKKTEKAELLIKYEGHPQVARKAPWDGGFVWSRDSTGKHFIGVACEGTGASLWWPCKDHLSSEPDSMYIRCSVPSSLKCISNGQLISQKTGEDNFTQYFWKVSYPINSYNVTVNIANYSHFSDTVTSGGKPLQLDYYVLPYNLEKAKKHFQQVKPMLKCYEKYFGPYPFHKDGYALVETPYYGMEHQGAIAYGNNYKNESYGLPFDFIIIHESGHEWWGNSVSCSDDAEMWLHESFTTYAEALYVECRFGYNAAIKYLLDQKKNIVNYAPMLGPMHVNYSGRIDNDIYYKGSWMLHTLRNVIKNDSLWFTIIYTFATNNKFSIVSTQDFIEHVNKLTGKNYNYFFEQYLRRAELPVFEYTNCPSKKNERCIKYRWNSTVIGFEMPVDAALGNHANIHLKPTAQWQTLILKKQEAKAFKPIDTLFLFETRKL